MGIEDVLDGSRKVCNASGAPPEAGCRTVMPQSAHVEPEADRLYREEVNDDGEMSSCPV